jgi:hypothetical protein
MKPDEKAEEARKDIALLEALLLRYVLRKGKVRYHRLRNVKIQRDERGAPLIDLTDIIDAVWNAAIGFQQIPPIDPKTNREVARRSPLITNIRRAWRASQHH